MIYVKEFGSPRELEDFLRGYIIGSNLIPHHVKGINVRGLTLTFTTPVLTVTFPDTSAFESVNAAAIAAEINSQAGANLAKTASYGYGSGSGVVILNRLNDVLTGGTATSILGLSAGTVGASAIPAASIVQVFISTMGRYGVVYDA